MLNINEIIQEADILVPNAVELPQKIVWLNAVNQDFFNVVKIPKTIRFDSVAEQSDYSIAGLSEKDIDKVLVGLFWYSRLNYNNVTTTENFFTYESDTLSLHPAPFLTSKGMVRYRQSASTTFTSSDLSSSPDAPKEYHWTFISALASFLANTEDDGIKASNYENQYKSAWNVAAQNYQVQGDEV
ncbi:hypothetical protein ACFSGI_09035 [Paenibacillus nicotianae]|uniref:Uncharacterized protein n=1 Tax=Paenibacillus nicotianae TaxID=1526551 RepID=A0ABW4UUJ0_9BACL